MTKPAPLYQSIADYIADGIRSKRFDASRRLPSEMELARKFDASRPTVVRAMVELQNRGLIERRVGSGTYIAPPPKAVVVHSGTLGLLAAGLGNTEILDPICAEISRHSEAKGFALFRGDTAADQTADVSFSVEQAESLVDRYIDRGVRGVYFAPLEMPNDRLAINRHIASRLSDAGIAVILLDRDIEEFGSRSEYDLVGIDNFAAGFALGAHLAEIGCTKIAFTAFSHYPSTTNLRYAGISEGLRHKGAQANLSAIFAGDPSDESFVSSLLDACVPDAIVCSNDRTAALLMQTLSGLRVSVPGQVSVAGFDDVRYATLLSVPLTTIHQPCHEIGLGAVSLMTDRLSNPTLPARHLTLNATLILRASTTARY